MESLVKDRIGWSDRVVVSEQLHSMVYLVYLYLIFESDFFSPTYYLCLLFRPEDMVFLEFGDCHIPPGGYNGNV